MLDVFKPRHTRAKKYHVGKTDMSDREARLKQLMGDLLFTIKEYSDKNEKPDEILFVLDRIVDAYRTAFESAGSGDDAALH
jgi:hypothetical protein